ncbi:tagatose 1,6-diphosphate aldolase [Aureimonas sp. AU40]|uniref:tagatose 1,6-diphosphate aldolase n=1 Tax=Aureimonas sp. AU40 TaxID=1637747 RepID=UPI000784EC01|nr:tagatose 1,6-diphosphate aldolase [Aureimonas sp. AU40]
MTVHPRIEQPASTVDLDPGKLRGLQRITTPDGFFAILALDHLISFKDLLAEDRNTVSYEQAVEAKLELVRHIAPVASAFLLEAQFSLAQVIASRALPGAVGLISSIEGEGFDVVNGERRTRWRQGWTVRKIKMLGADMVKLLWFYRPEAETAEAQRQVVRDLVVDCRAFSIPLVVEPIWYALPGEDTKSAAWAARRVEGIIESAHLAAEFGADMLKVEFPGDVSTPEGRDASIDACRRLDAGMSQPWVILSAGVGYEEFRDQVEVACRAGASGFLGGRSIWQDAVATRDPALRAEAAAAAAGRLSELTDIARRHGRAYRPELTGSELTRAYPDGWYAGWQEA